jgi:hypothetical protein
LVHRRPVSGSRRRHTSLPLARPQLEYSSQASTACSLLTVGSLDASVVTLHFYIYGVGFYSISFPKGGMEPRVSPTFLRYLPAQNVPGFK